jgi:fructokinase
MNKREHTAMNATPLLGIDLGGTKIEIAALDAHGQFLLRERVATPQGDYSATLQAIASLVHLAESRLNVSGLPLGMGTPGSISPLTGLMRGANSAVLNGRALRQDLQTLLARPVFMQNDANCLAVSEAVDGAGAGKPVVFAAILGTGVGGGVALNGKALTGPNAIAGEWGHNDELNTAPCWCGQTGCLETWVSGVGFAQEHARVTNQTQSAPDIITAMRTGDLAALASFDRYCDRLARALAQMCNLLDPEVIVLGGGMSNVPELYVRLPELVKRHVFSDVFTTPIVPTLHGDSSGVRGAAWLTRQALDSKP